MSGYGPPHDQYGRPLPGSPYQQRPSPSSQQYQQPPNTRPNLSQPYQSQQQPRPLPSASQSPQLNLPAGYDMPLNMPLSINNSSRPSSSEEIYAQRQSSNDGLFVRQPSADTIYSTPTTPGTPYEAYPPPHSQYQQMMPTPTSEYSNQYRSDDYPRYRDPYAPGGPLARKRTVRHIELTAQGNLVIDIPVPERVLQFGKYTTGDEFTHMRYTAATTDPNDFSKSFSLRQMEYGRQTEIFIVMTMYNEDDFLLTKTMSAVQKNVAHFCSRNRSKVWGPDGWKKIVVCVVADGRTKIHPRALAVLSTMGCYQDGIAKNQIGGKDVTAHIFEYTTQVCITPDLEVRGHERGVVPVQVLFCLKEKNAKKINSHRWFFNAFGPILRPNVCVLLDVGTKPSHNSIYHLWKAFDRDPMVAGACGEIYAELGTGCSKLLNPLVACQNFEYKMSNILDKPLESVFGYISVLPGAFSAYRYAALQNHPGSGNGPLASYFLGESMHGGADIRSANMYLAEDRILCFELVSKRDEAWVLRYVKSAKAETDVPDAIPEFVSQRRRWLNGSFFAGLHALLNFGHIFRSNHSIGRKFALMFEFLYNFINLIFTWFALGNFYLTFYFLSEAVTGDVTVTDPVTGASSVVHNPLDPFGGYGQIIFQVLREVYIFAIVVQFICSLGNRPQGSKIIYLLTMILFVIIMGSMLYMAGYLVAQSLPKNGAEWAAINNRLINSATFRDIVISLLSTYGLYLITSILFMEPWHMITSFVQYMLLLPSFVNILMVYAFCNLHDVSWGTKGDNVANDLGTVATKTGKDGQIVAEVAMLTERKDINAQYDAKLAELKVRPKEVKARRDAKTKQEDTFKIFRTWTVLFWVMSNAVLIIVLTTPQLTKFFNLQGDVKTGFNPYLTFIFWTVAGLSTVRFLGALSYLIQWFIRDCRIGG